MFNLKGDYEFLLIKHVCFFLKNEERLSLTRHRKFVIFFVQNFNHYESWEDNDIKSRRMRKLLF